MSKKLFLQANPIVASLVATILFAAVSMMSFLMFEPGVTFAITDTFTVEQEITAEISFETAPGDVVMAPDLTGITGGYAAGTTTVAIATNNLTGYTLDISFADSVAMQYEGGTESIPNFVDGGTPAYNFTVSSGQARFALAASSTNVVSEFRSNGTDTCNTGSTRSAAHCWTMEANATSLLRLVDRPDDTPAEGEETIIAFRVGVNNPSPALPAGFYNATATLTALID